MNQHSLRTLATRTLRASLLTSTVFALALATASSAQTPARPAVAPKPSAAVAQTGAASVAGPLDSSVAALHAHFLNPPSQARPMVRWWWFGPAVVKPEILRELQQMKADGIQGAEIAFEYAEVLDDPAKGLKNLPFLSPEMLDDVNYAQSEGRKLGLRIDLTLCSGWPYGGPNTPLAEAITNIRVAQVPVPAAPLQSPCRPCERANRSSRPTSPTSSQPRLRLRLPLSQPVSFRIAVPVTPAHQPVAPAVDLADLEDRAEDLRVAADAAEARQRPRLTQPAPSPSLAAAAAWSHLMPPTSPAPRSSSSWATPGCR